MARAHDKDVEVRKRANIRLWLPLQVAWQKSTAKTLKGHPWAHQSAAAIVDELRGGPAPSKRAKS